MDIAIFPRFDSSKQVNHARQNKGIVKSKLQENSRQTPQILQCQT
jgi:hypothetical protein